MYPEQTRTYPYRRHQLGGSRRYRTQRPNHRSRRRRHPLRSIQAPGRSEFEGVSVAEESANHPRGFRRAAAVETDVRQVWQLRCLGHTEAGNLPDVFKVFELLRKRDLIERDSDFPVRNREDEPLMP